MKSPGFFNRSSDRANGNKEAEERRVFRENLANMRTVSRKANGQVSASMDTAIVAGGLVGRDVKIIKQDTNSLHEKISTASSAIEQIAANVRQFNTIIEKQNAALSQTSSAIDEMSASVNSVTAITKMKLEASGKLEQVINKGGEDIMAAVRAISEVSVAVNSVAEITKVINDIAAQTNLLAMNAAIEAAHAGEQGKGFAVVAAEVRKLAESTSENSRAIANSLKTIIAQIRGAKETGERAASAAGNINKEVDQFVSAFAEISQSTSELSTGTGLILHSMDDLRNVSAEISGGSREISTGADSIETALTGIKDFSNNLLSDMDKIEEKIYDISGAQGGIVQYTVETNKNIEGFYHSMEESGDLKKENDLFNYDLIVLMHRNWLVQLRAFLDGRKENLKATPEDHLKCDLGKWIYGDGKILSDNRAYMELEEEHKKFHIRAGEIIQLRTGGNKSQAEDLYQKLMDQYHTVVSYLDKLRQKGNA